MRLIAGKFGGWTLGILLMVSGALAQSQGVSPGFPPPANQVQELPPQANCHVGLDDLSAGKRAYCRYLQRYATFHDGDMDKFVAQVMAERQTSMECAKQMIEKARDEYTRGDRNVLIKECYGIQQTTPDCMRSAMQWAASEYRAGRVASGGEINRRMHDCSQ